MITSSLIHREQKWNFDNFFAIQCVGEESQFGNNPSAFCAAAAAQGEFHDDGDGELEHGGDGMVIWFLFVDGGNEKW